MQKKKHFLAICIVMLLSGCAGTKRSSETLAPALTSFDKGPQSVEGVHNKPPSAQIANVQEFTGILTLEKALALTLANNPEIAASSWDGKIGDARTHQAGLWPNPELSFSLSDFGGTGYYRGTDASTSAVQLGQLFETGGKRPKRTRLAAVEKDLAVWDYEAKRLDVLAEANKNFLDVLAIQEKNSVAEELVRLAARARETVAERVKAGKISPLEETKAGVALSQTRIQLERTKTELVAARKRLATTMGIGTPGFQRVEGNLKKISSIPSSETLNAYLEQNPDVARWAKEKEQREASLALEKAKQIPDLTLTGGMQYDASTRDSALIVGVSFPLSFFDRNQGNIAEAEYKVAKAREESRAARSRATSTLAGAYQALASSYTESISLQDDIVPSAQMVFELTQEGFREGKFDFLELLDAQRTLFEARGSYVDSLSNYHKAVVDMERIIATPLAELSGTRQKNGKE